MMLTKAAKGAIVGALEAAIDDADLDAEVLPDYSGRWMYGAACIAIACGSPSDLTRLALSLGSMPDVPKDLLREMKGGGSSDSLGLGIVVYWPGLQTREARY